MKKYTEKEKQEWINRYLDGETARNISYDYNVSESIISRAIKNENLSRGKGKVASKEAIKNLVVEEYQNDKFSTLTSLGERYNLDPRTIKKWLKDKNIEVKQHSGKMTKCNQDYFEQIDTPHKAYLLGFITADGAITSKNNGLTKNCSMEIHNKDKELLEFAKSEINPEAKIIECQSGKKDNVKINFSSTKLCNDLIKYGVVQNKSKIIKEVPKDLIPKSLLKFYFRGLIDGDGCIYKDGKISIYSGSYDFISSVQNILCEESGVKKLKIYEGTTYFIAWGAQKDKIKLYNYLYSDLNDTYYYPRKYFRLYNSLYDNIEVTSQIAKGQEAPQSVDGE